MSSEMTEYKLSAESELRFEVEDETIVCELKTGLAEMFGTELMRGHKYSFRSGSKVAVFTYHGCLIELSGKPDVAYISRETPMTFYVNLSAGLEQLRISAQQNEKRGPVIMIVGPSDCGKSTLCRILLNYSVRMGRTPMFVDLDVGQGSVSIAGTVGAVSVERPADVEDGYSLVAPIVYHFGHTGPSENITLYNILIKTLSEAVELKMETEKKTKYSGIVINTCGWVKSYGYQSIIKASQDFNVNIIAVLDQERLYNELVRDVDKSVKVIFTPKSGGVVERARKYRIDSRDVRVRWYFYGSPKSGLYPYSFEVPFNQLRVYKVGAPNLPDSCMPIGMKTEDNKTKLVAVPPTAQTLLNHILSVSTATSIENNLKVIESNLFGFVCVTNVDSERQVVTLLAPQQRPLPSNSILLLSEIQFMDSH